MSLAAARQTHASGLRLCRGLHASCALRDRIAAPHPISHMRPVLYDDVAQPPVVGYRRHPYSLAEFREEEQATQNDHEMQYKLLRGQLDTLHQEFWLDSNTRFNAGREAILSSIPETAPPIQKEDALSEFHRQWLMQEKDRTDAYTQEWRSKNMQLIKLAARIEFQRMKNRVGTIFSQRSSG